MDAFEPVNLHGLEMYGLSSSNLPYIPFFTPERLSEFWNNVQSIAYLAMPMLVIYLATIFGGDLLRVIRDVFDRRRSNQDRDDYDRYDHD